MRYLQSLRQIKTLNLTADATLSLENIGDVKLYVVSIFPYMLAVGGDLEDANMNSNQDSNQEIFSRDERLGSLNGNCLYAADHITYCV